MSEDRSSYKQIFKATSIFGGVQVFNIIIQIIRSKIIAVLLGPAGMGIAGLFTATTGLISSLTNFGLGTSAVKDISASQSTNDQIRIAKTVTIVRKLVWFTGLFGMLICLLFSPLLSQLTFGNKEYTIAFIWLSIILLFNQLTSGQLVILQGLRKLQYLAKANLIGNAVGLLLTIPLYYFWGVDAIVPAIIIASLISFFIAWSYSKKMMLARLPISRKDTFHEGKSMLIMGFMISLSGLISMGTSYFIRIFINKSGGTYEVGLYNAGFAIVINYVGLIFNAMGTDYYPRLAAVASNNDNCKKVINQQAEVATLILAPIVMVFLVFIKWVTIFLYSNKFIPINEMIHWAALGMLFRSVAWSIAFIFLAKGASKTYFWSELIANGYSLGFNILGYHFWGLTGLGISFLIVYILYLIQVFIISNKLYNFSFYKSLIILFLIQTSLASFCLTTVKFLPSPLSYFVGSIFICISIFFSFRKLNNIFGLIPFIKNKFKQRS